MPNVTITIDRREVEVAEGASVLDAARQLGLDIPTLCYLEKCGPLNTCLVCLVKLNGKLVPSCGIKATTGMVVESETEEVREARRTALELLFSDHVGDCLSPCHRLCPLELNVPVMIRHIEAGRLQDAIKTVRQALPLAGVLGRLCHHPCEQGCRRGTWDDPAAIRELECFVADHDLKSPTRYLWPPKPSTGKTVVIIGAGPTGLSAAYFLAHEGHAVTVVDRNSKAGGSLRSATDEKTLPPEILDAEIALLEPLGIQFKLGIELGPDVTVEGLRRGFDAILLATGPTENTQIPGVECAGGLVKVNPETCETKAARVFAAGSAVKPAKKVVRAMYEGRMAGGCIHQFLAEKSIRRADKPFSSIMGRLDDDELKACLKGSNLGGTVTPDNVCAGYTRPEAATEASRCLHCDCRSSGNCALQFYAQVYGADASRFRTHRRPFEQQRQPGGIIFEPGKCILCGICVKLTEMAAEPFGLTFIERGMDVRVAAPFNREIEQGLLKVAAECVEHCPTGALVFSENSGSPSG